MNVLFIMKYPLDDSYNLKQKFDGQMAAVKRMGHNVYYIGWDMERMYLINGEVKMPIKEIHGAARESYIHRGAFLDLYKSVQIALTRAKFDVAYVRAMPFEWNGCSMMQALKKNGICLIMEIPTFPPEREKSKSFKRRCINKILQLWKRRYENLIDIYVVIGDDAKGNYKGKKAINTSNGVDVIKIEKRVPNLDDNKVHFLALASMSYWHGYDRLIQGLSQYHGNVEVLIHMVGGEGDGSLAEWKDLTRTLGLLNVVRFEGRKQGGDLAHFFNICDVGIGSLGIYREGIKHSSTLKIREYTARGLPFVYATSDPAIPDDFPFSMKVPDNDTPIDIQSIVDFALELRKDLTHVDRMRAYARENMSWESQLEKIFEAIW